MNYVILNGKNSNTIKGLIIQELPPITKPGMAVSTTTIDGRDGDIQDYLGFNAYDKTISIGLHGNYDIDEVIDFFHGKGQAIFSNEPDKYYNYSIYAQMDYERLIKFRTAKVKLHVQPFKYLVSEKIIDKTITTETQIKVNNLGLQKCKPIFTLYGIGNIEILIDSVAVFEVEIDDDYICIDSLIEEACKGSVLKNRNMIGEFPMLDIGERTITWNGNLTRIIIEPKSRWL